MNISTAAGVQRRRGGQVNRPEDEVNAAELKLGPEFQLKQIDNHGEPSKLITLNLSEARILIRAALKERINVVQSMKGEDQEDKDKMDTDNDMDDETLVRMATTPGANEVLIKTLKYLSTFSRFKDAETCTAAETLLKSEENSSLHPFEVAQLGSLACEDTDEAITLIPSLNDKKDKVDLERILDELNRLETNYP